MKIFFASSSEFGIPVAEVLTESHLIDGFISNPSRPTGRNQLMSENHFTTWARGTSIPVYQPQDNSELEELLRSEGVDLVVTTSYGLIIKKTALEVPKYGWFNIHFSILPSYRGAAPIQRAIENGETETGVTLFKMDQGLDTGPIVYQKKISISKMQMASELILQLAEMVAEDLPGLLTKIDSWVFRDQSGKPTFAPKISKSERQVNWSNSSATIYNKYRAFDFNGGIHSFFKGNQIILSRIELSEKLIEEGTIEIHSGEIYVGTGTSAIRLLEVKAAGKRQMSAIEWSNGLRLSVGEKFE
jgi:methionyl-tRNA formyltransferase